MNKTSITFQLTAEEKDRLSELGKSMGLVPNTNGVISLSGVIRTLASGRWYPIPLAFLDLQVQGQEGVTIKQLLGANDE